MFIVLNRRVLEILCMTSVSQSVRPFIKRNVYTTKVEINSPSKEINMTLHIHTIFLVTTFMWTIVFVNVLANTFLMTSYFYNLLYIDIQVHG